MSSDKEDRSKAAQAFSTLAVSTIPLLGLVFALEIGAWFLDAKSTALDSDGIVATATVYDVTSDLLGESLTVLSESKRDVGPGQKTKLQHWTRHYHFYTEDGVEVKGSYSGQAYEKPPIDQTLQVRYSPSDPTVHETAIGHTESQGAALHWIALTFAMIWVGIFIWAVVQICFPRRLTTRERRLKRMEELQLLTEKKLDNTN